MKRDAIKIKPEEIIPYATYGVDEVAKILNTHPNTIRNLKANLRAKRVGKGYRILGENVLIFMGSPSIARMGPNK